MGLQNVQFLGQADGPHLPTHFNVHRLEGMWGCGMWGWCGMWGCGMWGWGVGMGVVCGMWDVWCTCGVLKTLCVLPMEVGLVAKLQ